jgi:Asp-tRNA(Asn)/Glu-tRNA(Gln) amidotransferase A subunit family amidase
VVVPCGVSDAADYAGLPIGLQLVGASFQEASLLGLAHAYEVTSPRVTRAE